MSGRYKVNDGGGQKLDHGTNNITTVHASVILGDGASNGQAPLSRKKLIASFYWIRSPEDEDLVSDSLKVKCISRSKFLLGWCLRWENFWRTKVRLEDNFKDSSTLLLQNIRFLLIWNCCQFRLRKLCFPLQHRIVGRDSKLILSSVSLFPLYKILNLCVVQHQQLSRASTPRAEGDNGFRWAEPVGTHPGNPYNHFPKVRHAKYADARDPLPDMRRDDNTNSHRHTHTSADV